MTRVATQKKSALQSMRLSLPSGAKLGKVTYSPVGKGTLLATANVAMPNRPAGEQKTTVLFNVLPASQTANVTPVPLTTAAQQASATAAIEASLGKGAQLDGKVFCYLNMGTGGSGDDPAMGPGAMQLAMVNFKQGKTESSQFFTVSRGTANTTNVDPVGDIPGQGPNRVASQQQWNAYTTPTDASK